jgi:hypothetical protein
MGVRDLARSLGLASKLLAVAVAPQEGRNWCWAACASAVSRFYDPGNEWTQCAVANATLSRTDCCEVPSSCDKIQEVKIALTRTGNLALGQNDPIAGAALRAQLGRGHPVVARVDFGKGRGHFVVIEGSLPAGFFRIRDPGDEGTLDMTLNTLLRRYKRLATCTHMYRTHA